jgi:hypothetical protein
MDQALEKKIIDLLAVPVNRLHYRVGVEILQSDISAGDLESIGGVSFDKKDEMRYFENIDKSMAPGKHAYILAPRHERILEDVCLLASILSGQYGHININPIAGRMAFFIAPILEDFGTGFVRSSSKASSLDDITQDPKPYVVIFPNGNTDLNKMKVGTGLSRVSFELDLPVIPVGFSYRGENPVKYRQLFSEALQKMVEDEGLNHYLAQKRSFNLFMHLYENPKTWNMMQRVIDAFFRNRPYVFAEEADIVFGQPRMSLRALHEKNGAYALNLRNGEVIDDSAIRGPNYRILKTFSGQILGLSHLLVDQEIPPYISAAMNLA